MRKLDNNINSFITDDKKILDKKGIQDLSSAIFSVGKKLGIDKIPEIAILFEGW